MYATVSQLKEYLSVSGDEDDALLERLLKAATAAIEAYCARRFSGREDTRRYGWESIAGIDLWLDDDLLDVQQVTNGGELESSDYILLPRNGPPYSRIRARGGWNPAEDVVVTGTWGYSAEPPENIVHACIRLAAYYYRQRDAQVFDVTAVPEQGVITVPKGMPADVRQILDRYRRLV